MLGLDITANAYLIETQKAVGLWDVSSGCVKTVFFGRASRSSPASAVSPPAAEPKA